MTDAVFTLDQSTIQDMITKAVETKILAAVENLVNDPNWLLRIEKTINQTVAYETLTRVSSIDINSIVNQRVDENITKFQLGLKGLDDKATKTQVTVMDETTVIENTLTAREVDIVDGARINNLAVTGSINTDNQAWDTLAKNISDKTLAELDSTWTNQLINQVTEQIKTNGISFDDIKIGEQSLINGNTLNSNIINSGLQTVGPLRNLKVTGEAHINTTMSVVNSRVGINTDIPELALSVWDEEVSVNIGKFKNNEAYIGTSRLQALSIGVNRTPQIDISADGLTTIKKLRVGLYMISHSADVPGWSGTKGDLVINSNIKDDKVFAWICLGAYRWQPLKSA
jgi:hypothetical protein